MRDDRLPAHLLHRDLLALGERISGADQEDQFIGPQGDRLQFLLRREEGQHAEVHRTQQHFLRDLSRMDAAHLDEHAGMVDPEGLEQRQECVNTGLVGADHHAALLDVAQFMHADRRFLQQTDDALGVRKEELSGVRQRAVARRAIDEPLSGGLFKAANGLTDGGLSTAQFLCCAGETALGCNRGEYAKVFGGHVYKII